MIKPKHDKDGGSNKGNGKDNSSGGKDKPGAKTLIVGRDGDTVKMENGQEFVYKNQFAGWFYDDPKDPFNNGAKAQSYTPGLNETWDYTKDLIRGCVASPPVPLCHP